MSTGTGSSAGGVEQYRGQSTLVSVLAGAVVTVITSFVPLSPVLGGGVAAYLYSGDRGDGTRVGAISGAVATVPVLLGVVIIAGFLALAPVGISPRAFGASLVFLLLLVVVFAVVVLYTVGLSALGGYLAVLLQDRPGTDGNTGADATAAAVGHESVDGGEAGSGAAGRAGDGESNGGE